jgi:hypothetical protein
VHKEGTSQKCLILTRLTHLEANLELTEETLGSGSPFFSLPSLLPERPDCPSRPPRYPAFCIAECPSPSVLVSKGFSEGKKRDKDLVQRSEAKEGHVSCCWPRQADPGSAVGPCLLCPFTPSLSPHLRVFIGCSGPAP